MDPGAIRAALIAALAAVLAGPFAAQAAWRMHVIDGDSRGADGVRLHDVNADGLPDVATAFEEGGVVKLYLHPGHARVRKPWPAAVVGRVPDPEDAVPMDVDGDGKAEVISATERGDGKLYVHRQAAAGWQTTPIPASFTGDSWMLSLCEYRAFAYLLRVLGFHEACWRGKMPQRWMYVLPLKASAPAAFIAGSKEHNASVTLFVKSGPADVDWNATPLARAGWVMSLIELDGQVIYSDRRGSDLDGNGKFDDGLDPRRPGSPRRGIFALSKNANAWEKRVLAHVDAELMFMDVGDLDGDGVPDIVAATKGGYVLWLRGLGRGDYEARKIPVPPTSADLKAVAIGDMNGDGRADLVLAVESARGNAPRVYAMLLNKDASVRAVVDISGARGQKFDRLELVDLDGDGDLDVLTTEELDGLGVIWFENPSKATPRGPRQ